MDQVHLTVYYNARRDAHDGRGFCVDIDHPDYQRKRSPGIGNGFATAKQAAEFVAEWLQAFAHGEPEEFDAIQPDSLKRSAERQIEVIHLDDAPPDACLAPLEIEALIPAAAAPRPR
jgi:hypothetical protein